MNQTKKNRIIARADKLTVRERMEGKKTRRVSVRPAGKKLASATAGVRGKLGKTYHLPLPDSKIGNILSKKVVLFPSFLKNSFKELRMVEWPNARMTLKLSFAVIIFSVIFSAFIGIVDFGLGKLFKEVILNK
jgi:preprotein translocase SecE subunit